MNLFDHEPLSKISDRESPFKLTLEVKTDFVECLLKTSLLILTSSNTVLNHTDTVPLTISL